MKSQKVWQFQGNLLSSYTQFDLVLFITLYKGVQTLEPVDEILMYKSNESFFTVIRVVLFIMLYKVVLTFESVDEILKCGH